MGNTAKFMLFTMSFIIFFGFVAAEISETTYELISPLTISVLSASILAVISVANTPVVKGVAAAGLWAVLFGLFFIIDIPLIVYGLFLVPIIIGMGFAMMEAGEG